MLLDRAVATAVFVLAFVSCTNDWSVVGQDGGRDGAVGDTGAADSANDADAQFDPSDGDLSDAEAGLDGSCGVDSGGPGCLVCEAGTFRCEGQRLERCAGGDAWLLQEECPVTSQCNAASAICANQTCTDLCGAPANECFVATCTPASQASCGTGPKRAHAACAAGVCDGAGNCVACADASDCTSGTASHCVDSVCVQCRNAGDCNAGAHEICSNGTCVVGPYCGDGVVNGGEACDPKAPTWDVFTCDAGCKARKLYNTCNTNDVTFGGLTCAADATCGMGHCWYSCSSAADCPAPPNAALQPFCWDGQACVLTGCRTQADCPKGVPCQTVGTGQNWCWGCMDDSTCPHGQRCIRRVLPNGVTVTSGYCE